MRTALLRPAMLSRALIERSGSFARLERQAELELASVAATIGAMEAGFAVTIAPKVLVREQFARGDLISRPITDPAPVRRLVMLSRQSDGPTRLRETMIALIEQMAHRAIETGD